MKRTTVRLFGAFFLLAFTAAISYSTLIHVKAAPFFDKSTASILSTFHLRAETQSGGYTVTGHGTAFGIDLSEFGLDKPRYLLTACHVVRESDGRMRPMLKIEVRHGDETSVVQCKVLAFDSQMDISLLESETDLPVRAQFADHPTECGSPVRLVGCPTGIEPTRYDGFLTEQDGHGLSSARVEFFKQGCSGCPVFDGNSLKVIGVAVAGVRKGNGMDPHTSLFIPLEGVKHFVGLNLPKADLEQTALKRMETAALEKAQAVAALKRMEFEKFEKAQAAIEAAKVAAPSSYICDQIPEPMLRPTAAYKKARKVEPARAEVVDLNSKLFREIAAKTCAKESK